MRNHHTKLAGDRWLIQIGGPAFGSATRFYAESLPAGSRAVEAWAQAWASLPPELEHGLRPFFPVRTVAEAGGVLAAEVLRAGARVKGKRTVARTGWQPAHRVCYIEITRIQKD